MVDFLDSWIYCLLVNRLQIEAKLFNQIYESYLFASIIFRQNIYSINIYMKI